MNIPSLNMGYFYLFFTILTTVCSQLIIKWRVSSYVTSLLPMPEAITGKLLFLFKVIFDPFIFIALCLTFTSGLCWMATMTKLEISYAYPFTMLGFIAVLSLSMILFGESCNIYKITGALIIVLGVIITSRGL